MDKTGLNDNLFLPFGLYIIICFFAIVQNSTAQLRDREQDLPPLIQLIPEAGIELPPAPSGQPPKRKIELISI